jgi:hypothetical protein
LNESRAADSAAVKTCTGMETSPNEIVIEAMGRPAMSRSQLTFAAALSLHPQRSNVKPKRHTASQNSCKLLIQLESGM